MTSLRLVAVGSLAFALAASCSDSSFKGAEATKNGDANATDGGGTDPSTDSNATAKRRPKTPADTDSTASKTGKPKVKVPGETDDAKNQLKSDTPIAVDHDATCSKSKQGLAGKVYKLKPGTDKLPDLDPMTPIGEIEAINLNVPPRDWKNGFPALPDLVEWFAISFFGKVEAPVDGAYILRSNSDDGSKVYIDGNLVLDNDGQHVPTVKVSGDVQLTKGSHDLRVDWFQGPRFSIALQVWWKVPGQPMTILPATAVSHTLDCGLKNLGTFPSNGP